MWGRTEPRFDICEYLDNVEPDDAYFTQPTDFDEDDLYVGRRVAWVGVPGAMLRIDADMITATPGNPFNFGQLAFLRDAIANADGSIVLEAPAARIHTVSEAHMEESQRAFDDGEDYGGMTRPWDPSDVGKLYAHLLDGNHRAFAAICAGEPYVWVIVGPNYRDDVRDLLE